MHENEFEQLIQSITDLVLAKLRSSTHIAERARTLTVLWPVASAAQALVMAGVAAFRSENHRVRWLVRDDLVESLLPLLPARERDGCHPLSQAPLQSILADMESTDVVLLAATHFEGARQLLSMNDEHPWVHVLLQAHLSGQKVLLCDDLLRSRGGASQNPVAQKAAELKRELGKMGFTLVAAQDLARVLKDLTMSRYGGSQNERGLLTEQDVEDLVRAGHRELRLHAKTLVTPLAETKAAELGLTLIRTQA